MRNLGPRSGDMLPQAGITTPAELRAADPFVVYARLRQCVPGTSLNALYALIGAVEDLDWRVVMRERRMEFLLRLDDMGIAPGPTRKPSRTER